MRHKWYWVLVVFTLITAVPAVKGQNVSAIIKQADTQFKNESYYKAAGLYMRALEIAPSNMTATYRLAESYRLIFLYTNAEYYYELALRAENSYNLVRFYYAQAQKFNGKYEEALNNFQMFIEKAESNGYPRLTGEAAASWAAQARVEREGCLLALKELSKPQQDNKFQVVASPISTEYQDFAPAIYGNDSSIVISSTRSDSKGSNFDGKFGESLMDVFEFEKNSRGQWTAKSTSDRFDRSVNSNFNDGIGSFNKDFTSFYFTHCANNTGCKIYVTKKIDGRWNEAVPLNTNINALRSDSGHPALTSTGDTLFFLSNRKGGYDEMDIYMSIDAGVNSWGPATNLGDHINTKFMEYSPFYDSKEKKLFFSSKGHKGHGGHDIFMAEKIFDPTTELYNMGLPFNSSRDDAFFVLGEKVGYLSSNRDGGVGKYDIYTFEIDSDEEIIAEILNFKEVAVKTHSFPPIMILIPTTWKRSKK